MGTVAYKTGRTVGKAVATAKKVAAWAVTKRKQTKGMDKNFIPSSGSTRKKRRSSTQQTQSREINYSQQEGIGDPYGDPYGSGPGEEVDFNFNPLGKKDFRPPF